MSEMPTNLLAAHYRALVRTFIARSRYAEAAAAGTRGVIAHPADRSLWEHTAHARHMAGDAAGAVAAFERAAELGHLSHQVGWLWQMP